jgi:hypothetical protein
MATDLQAIDKKDLGILIAGGVAFIASLLPYVGVDVDFGGLHASNSVNAWHSYAILGLLLIFAGAIVVALKVFGGDAVPELPVGVHVLAAALAGLGTLLVLIRAFTYSDNGVPGADVSVKWGGYLLILAGIVEAVLAVLAMRESGESIPGVSSGRTTPPPPPPAA